MEIESGEKIARRVALSLSSRFVPPFFRHTRYGPLSPAAVSSGEVHAPSRVTFAGYNVNPRQSYLERYKEGKKKKGEGREGKEEGKRE